MNRFFSVCMLGTLLTLPLSVGAQSNPSAAAGLAAGAALGASTNQSATTPSTAGSSTAPIEMNIIVYGGVKLIAKDMAMAISKDICIQGKCSEPNKAPLLLEDSTTPTVFSMHFTWDAMEKALSSQISTLSKEITADSDALQALRSQVQSAIDAANRKGPAPKPKHGIKAPDKFGMIINRIEELEALDSSAPSSPIASAAPTTPIGLTYLGDIGTALSTAKSGISYSSSSITPATQALTAELGKALLDHNVDLYTTASLINLKEASENVIGRIAEIQKENAEAQAKTTLENSIPTPTGVAKDDPAVQRLVTKASLTARPLVNRITANTSAANQLLTAFLTWQAGTDNSGSTILSDAVRGEAINKLVGDGVDVLQLNIDAAGGNTRTNSFFLYNLFYTPKPSFNGGVVVTYELRDKANKLLDGDTLQALYDYSKWKPNCFQMKHADLTKSTKLSDGRIKDFCQENYFVCETK